VRRRVVGTDEVLQRSGLGGGGGGGGAALGGVGGGFFFLGGGGGGCALTRAQGPPDTPSRC
jgi:hypothetical protein